MQRRLGAQKSPISPTAEGSLSPSTHLSLSIECPFDLRPHLLLHSSSSAPAQVRRGREYRRTRSENNRHKLSPSLQARTFFFSRSSIRSVLAGTVHESAFLPLSRGVHCSVHLPPVRTELSLLSSLFLPCC